jgi:hypothetical protein
MKARLLHREQDVELVAELPAGHEALVDDLGLDDVFDAMAGGDPFLRDVARTVLLMGLRDPDEIAYRQQVLADCIDHPAVVRQLYDLAVTAVEAERQAWRIYSRNPELVVSMSTRALELFRPILHELRHVADTHAAGFASAGFGSFFATLRSELGDDFLRGLADYLRLLQFQHGVSINGRLGRRNMGTGFVLLRPAGRGWGRILPRAARGYTIRIAEGDDAGMQALADLRARGISLVANALGQAVDHTLSFFAMLRFEVGFYLACLNLRDRLLALGGPAALPGARPAGSMVLSARGLYDPGLALRLGTAIVGNDLEADGQGLVVISGANQGGKSTFLRSLGLAQLMLQAGMFVAAESFTADVRGSILSHFKRAEDPTMLSGKFDEELRRFSELVDRLSPPALVLFNESFAATNEREGADIAEGVVRALLEAGTRIVFVTHSYELARRFDEPGASGVLFLSAERLPDGRRTFRLRPGPPVLTSYGDDLFRRIFAEAPAEAVPPEPVGGGS